MLICLIVSFSALSHARAVSILSRSWRGPCSFWAYMTPPSVMWHTSLLIRYQLVFGQIIFIFSVTAETTMSILVWAGCYESWEMIYVRCLSVIRRRIQIFGSETVKTVSLVCMRWPFSRNMTFSVTGMSWRNNHQKAGCICEGGREGLESEVLWYNPGHPVKSSSSLHTLTSAFTLHVSNIASFI